MSDPYLPPPEGPDHSSPYGYPAPQQAGPQGPVELPPKPSSVRSLIGVMLAGAALAAFGVLSSLLSTDLVMAELARTFDDMQMEGVDGDDVLAVGRPLFIGTVIVLGLLEVGLWLLFAWLFAKGRGRVVGTVLGALNLVTALFGFTAEASTNNLVLNLLRLVVIVAGLVLLWLPSTSAWFSAAKAARQPRY